MKIIFPRLINDNVYVSFDERSNWSLITEDNIIIPKHTKDGSFDPGNKESRISNILIKYGYRFYKNNYRTTSEAAFDGSNAPFELKENSSIIFDNNFDQEVKDHLDGQDMENIDIGKVYIKNVLGFVAMPEINYELGKELRVNFNYETNKTVVKSLKNVGLTTHGKLDKKEEIVSLKLTGLTKTNPINTNQFKFPSKDVDRNQDTSLAYLIEYLHKFQSNDINFRNQKIDITPTWFPEYIALGKNFSGLQNLYGITINQKQRSEPGKYEYYFKKLTKEDDKENEGKWVWTKVDENMSDDVIKGKLANLDNYSVDEEAFINCRNLQKLYLNDKIERIEHGAFFNTDINTRKVTFGDINKWILLGAPYDEDFLLGFKIDVSSPLQAYREMKSETREQENNTDAYVRYFKAPPSDTETLRDGYYEADPSCLDEVVVKERKEGWQHKSNEAHKLNHYFNLVLDGRTCNPILLPTDTTLSNGTIIPEGEIYKDEDNNTKQKNFYNMSLSANTLITLTDENGKECLVDIYNKPITYSGGNDAFALERTRNTNGELNKFVNVCFRGKPNQSLEGISEYKDGINTHISRLYVDYLCYKNADDIIKGETSETKDNTKVKFGSTSEARLQKVNEIINQKTYNSMYKN